MMWARSPNGRHPSVRTSDQLIEVDLLACVGDLPDGVRPALALARLPASGFGGLDVGSRALRDERAFKLRDCAEHLQGKFTLRRPGVDHFEEMAH
jgi:hypothetical protein